MVLELLRAHKLYAKFGMCEFWLEEVKFLGHVVSGEGVSVDTSKTEAVQDWAQPKSVFEICSFSGVSWVLSSVCERFLQVSVTVD